MKNIFIVGSLFAISIGASVVNANPNDSALTKNGEFMICQLSGNNTQGSVTLSAQNRLLDLSFDAGAQGVFGLNQATNLIVTLDTFNSGTPTGPLDFLEMDHGGNTCDIGIDFAKEGQIQSLVTGSPIALKPITGGADGYRSIQCGQQKMTIVSCTSAGNLKNVEDVGHYLKVVEGD
jgi:hypothetical protein